MKKRIFSIVLVILTLVFCFSLSTFALSPTFRNGDPAKTGHWFLSTGYIKGQFGLDRPLEDLYTAVFPMVFPAQIYEDYRDENGDGLCIYIMNMTFSEGFTYNSYFHYDTLQLLFREYDSSGEGYLNDVNLLSDGNFVSLFHTDGTLESTYYEQYAQLDFGRSNDSNYWYGDDYGTESLFRWYMTAFSGPVIDNQVQISYGVFVPIVYTFGVIEGGPSGGGSGAGPGGGGSGGVITPPGSDSDNDAVSAFGTFFGLVVSSFNSLLSIEFFGGLFALRDIIGLVIVLSMLTVFLRWFAGG